MKIQGREITGEDYLSPVTYVPKHAQGSTRHPDCERGVIIKHNQTGVAVLYSYSRTVQITQPEDLIWG